MSDPIVLKIRYEVEDHGHEVYVIERQLDFNKSTTYGPMHRDTAMPFIDERKAWWTDLSTTVSRRRWGGPAHD